MPWLWRQLRCPVYATPFAAAVLRRKLAELQMLAEVKLRVVPPGGAIDLPSFSLRYLRVAHSIPEAQALVIESLPPHSIVLGHAGTIIHRSADDTITTEEQPVTESGALAVLTVESL